MTVDHTTARGRKESLRQGPPYRVVLLDAGRNKEAGEGEVCLALDPRPLGLMVGYMDSVEKTAEAMRGGYCRTLPTRAPPRVLRSAQDISGKIRQVQLRGIEAERRAMQECAEREFFEEDFPELKQ